MRVLLIWCVAFAAATAADSFVTRSGTGFVLNGNSFHPAGTNCYYLTYKSQAMVDAALADAKAMGVQVVRVWGFLDCGNGDPGAAIPVLPTNSDNKDGVYFQYWDTTAGALRINDGPFGLQRLDYVIYKAEQLGLKVTVCMVNNWSDFGGMDQYVRWFGQTYHDQFYTDAAIGSAFQAYMAHLVSRTNIYTTRQYRDEPAIFSWELANEPRCIGSTGLYNRSTTWTTATITTWASTMASYLKSIDTNHLVAVGDEGFFNRVGGSDWAYKGEGGVDHEALIALSAVDYATFHLYPDNWTKSVGWGTQWVIDHCTAASTAGKPTVLGEYGYQNPLHTEAERMAAYVAWGDALRNNGGDGSWFWMIAGFDPTGPGNRYPDYDHYTVYLDGLAWQPGDIPIDDDDVIAAQAWSLRGLDNRAPVAVASVLPSSALTAACDGSGSSDLDGQTLTYAWNFGDGTLSTAVSPGHVYTAAGTYTVTLTVSDPYALSDTDSALVTVTAGGSGGGSSGGSSSSGGGGGGCGLGTGLALLGMACAIHRPRRRPAA